MGLVIERFDHIVLNCRDVQATASWYESVLGMAVEQFGPQKRTALKFGNQKINLRPTGPNEGWATGASDAPGSADVCFITASRPDEVLASFARLGVDVVEGPTPKTGALGPMTSVYCRDPDGNLVEVASYDH
ncbi:MAG: VOC family protein [Segniliparus sp.]|uniref:VOC family protein n=1 Tax=Segniliparus sp. TaxID=2804064 RepID=UPI003F31DD49